MTGTEIKRRQREFIDEHDAFVDALMHDLMTYGQATAEMMLHQCRVITYRELRELTIERHERQKMQETP